MGSEIILLTKFVRQSLNHRTDPNQQYYGGQPGGYPPPQQPGGGFPQPGYPMPQAGYPMPPMAGGVPYPQPGGYPPPGGFPPSGFVPHMPPPNPNASYGAGYDPEDPEVKGFDFTDESIRKGFIRKVYSILCVS